MLLEKRKDLQDLQSIVILTGAGASAESGIRTFRASDGLWEEHRVEDVATPEGFRANPAFVQKFYNDRRRQLLAPSIQPNACHQALARLEREFVGPVLLVTQNIDNLHERAGSRNLVHMHGELLKMRCEASGRVYEIQGEILPDTRCACCKKNGTLRPHIVWFGEMPLEMERIYQALSVCDLFIAIGTSGHVYPAAGFVEAANTVGARTIEINLEASAVVSRFDESRRGLASQLVPQLVAEILANCSH